MCWTENPITFARWGPVSKPKDFKSPHLARRRASSLFHSLVTLAFDRHEKYTLVICLICVALNVFGQNPVESDYYKIAKIATPEGVVLEVGGLALLPNGDMAASTRRGDVYIIENPNSTRPYFRKFASGLHEILGLAYKDGFCIARNVGN